MTKMIKPVSKRKIKYPIDKKILIFGIRCFNCFANCCWRFCKLYQKNK